MSDGALAALVGLIGVLLGGVLQAAFHRFNTRDDFVRQKKTEAYLLFFEGVAELSHAQTDQEAALARAKVAEARGQCVLYAGDDVLQKMVVAWRCGPISAEDLTVHAEMIRAMRQDALGRASLSSDQVLFETVFGSVEQE